ncbi:MAG: hypothetical protein L6Q72_03905, partial [Burkholderiaceae bacterium]|nr:hypothetical protein [Burkholderiaceae bacterium]
DLAPAGHAPHVSILARAEARALLATKAFRSKATKFQSSRAPRRARCEISTSCWRMNSWVQSSRAPRRARCGSRASSRNDERSCSRLANLRIDALLRPRRVRHGEELSLPNQVLARLREPVPSIAITSGWRMN